MFSVCVVSFPELVSLPSPLEVTVRLINRSRLPKGTPFKLRLKIRELDETVLSLNRQPVYSTHYDPRDGACRFVCPRRGTLFDPQLPSSPSKHAQELVHEGTLERGIMELTLISPLSHQGFYIFESAWIDLPNQEEEIRLQERRTEEIDLLADSNEESLAAQKRKEEQLPADARAEKEDDRIEEGIRDIEISSDEEERRNEKEDGKIVEENGATKLKEHRIENVDHRMPFFVIVQRKPNRIMIEERDLISGIDERVRLSIEPAADLEASELKITSSDESLRFLDNNNALVTELLVSIPSVQNGIQYSFDVSMFLPLNAEFIKEPISVKRKICVQWLEKPYYVEVSFIPLFTIQRKIATLESKSLLVFELGRPPLNDSTIIFDSAHLEANWTDSEKPPALAKMLNQNIVDLEPSAISTLVWVLPVDGPAVKHTLNLKYRIKRKTSDIFTKEDKEYYKYEEEKDMNVCKVSYEMCAQILSQQPGAQLCRAGAPCDFVVSVRSLSHTVEMLYVVLDADEKLWILTERAKVMSLKESGLGQIVFSIVPCIAGFLPYPSINIYSCIGTAAMEDYLPGSPLMSYHRTEGKQIRVLAPSADATAFPGNTGSIRGKIKKLTGKIFNDQNKSNG